MFSKCNFVRGPPEESPEAFSRGMGISEVGAQEREKDKEERRK